MSRYENMLYRFYNLNTSDHREIPAWVIPIWECQAIGETYVGKTCAGSWDTIKYVRNSILKN